MKKTGVCLTTAYLLVFIFTHTAFAVESQGILAGAFIVKPQVTLGVEFNDNIYATEEDQESDVIVTLAPRLDARSIWSRHALGLNAGVTGGFYSSEGDENYFDGHLVVDGRVDIVRNAFILAEAGIKRLHEERGAPDAVGAWDEPAVYSQSNFDLTGYVKNGLFAFTGGGGVTLIDYSEVDLVGGGSDLLDYKDRKIFNVNARVDYDMHPEVQPFLAVSYEWRRYNESWVDRDSAGTRIGAGTAVYLGGVTSLEVLLGYMNQAYDERDDISGLWTGVNLLWLPTQLTTVTAGVMSSVEETTLAASSGISRLNGNVGVDHQIRRNMTLGAMVDYTHNDYEGIDRTDGYLSIGPRLTWLVNRNLEARAAYTFKSRSSSGTEFTAEEYSQNLFKISLTARY